MKVLGKKISNAKQTIDAYSIACACASCSCTSACSCVCILGQNRASLYLDAYQPAANGDYGEDSTYLDNYVYVPSK